MKNNEDFSSVKLDDLSIKNEEKVKSGENLSLKNAKILYEKIEKSVCQIIKDNGYGTGFFCKIKYSDKPNGIICLVTNNHVITKYMITNKEYIEIKINNTIKNISLNYYRKIWTDENIDFTCIEIIDKDNIIKLINPFEIDDNSYNKDYNIKEYNKRGIVSGVIGGKEEIELPQGVIYYINNNSLFFHNCNTEPGTSGGPLILINNLKLIGIHKGYEENNKKNIGIYFHEILKEITKEKLIYKNVVECILDIKLKEIKEGF